MIHSIHDIAACMSPEDLDSLEKPAEFQNTERLHDTNGLGVLQKTVLPVSFRTMPRSFAAIAAVATTEKQ
jgi:hypothetical protein